MPLDVVRHRSSGMLTRPVATNFESLNFFGETALALPPCWAWCYYRQVPLIEKFGEGRVLWRQSRQPRCVASASHTLLCRPPLLFWPGLPWAPFGGPCFGLVGLGPRWALPALGGWGPVGPCLRLFLGLGWGLVECVSVGARHKQRGWLLSPSLQNFGRSHVVSTKC